MDNSMRISNIWLKIFLMQKRWQILSQALSITVIILVKQPQKDNTVQILHDSKRVLQTKASQIRLIQ